MAAVRRLGLSAVAAPGAEFAWEVLTAAVTVLALLFTYWALNRCAALWCWCCCNGVRFGGCVWRAWGAVRAAPRTPLRLRAALLPSWACSCHGQPRASASQRHPTLVYCQPHVGGPGVTSTGCPAPGATRCLWWATCWPACGRTSTTC